MTSKIGDTSRTVTWGKFSQHLRFALATSAAIADSARSDSIELLHLFAGVLCNDNSVTRLLRPSSPDIVSLRRQIDERFHFIRFGPSEANLAVEVGAKSLFSLACADVFYAALEKAIADSGKPFIDDLYVTLTIFERKDPDVETLLQGSGVARADLYIPLCKWRERLKVAR